MKLTNNRVSPAVVGSRSSKTESSKTRAKIDLQKSVFNNTRSKIKKRAKFAAGTLLAAGALSGAVIGLHARRVQIADRFEYYRNARENDLFDTDKMLRTQNFLGSVKFTGALNDIVEQYQDYFTANPEEAAFFNAQNNNYIFNGSAVIPQPPLDVTSKLFTDAIEGLQVVLNKSSAPGAPSFNSQLSGLVSKHLFKAFSESPFDGSKAFEEVVSEAQGTDDAKKKIAAFNKALSDYLVKQLDSIPEDDIYTLLKSEINDCDSLKDLTPDEKELVIKKLSSEFKERILKAVQETSLSRNDNGSVSVEDADYFGNFAFKSPTKATFSENGFQDFLSSIKNTVKHNTFDNRLFNISSNTFKGLSPDPKEFKFTLNEQFMKYINDHKDEYASGRYIDSKDYYDSPEWRDIVLAALKTGCSHPQSISENERQIIADNICDKFKDMHTKFLEIKGSDSYEKLKEYFKLNGLSVFDQVYSFLSKTEAELTNKEDEENKEENKEDKDD